MSRAAYIVSAVRTPIGKFGGGLAELTAADLGVIAVRAALERAFGAAPTERKAGEFAEREIPRAPRRPRNDNKKEQTRARNEEEQTRRGNDSRKEQQRGRDDSEGIRARGQKEEQVRGLNEKDARQVREPGARREILRSAQNDSPGVAGGAPGVRWRVDEVFFGSARQAGGGPNVARQIAWRAGLGDDVPAVTVNMACASGLRAILLGWQQILLGEAEIVVAGGTESMSRLPYLVEARWGFKMGHQPLVDAMYRDGFLCPMSQLVMGETAELLAEQYSIAREEQDRYALESHQRAAAATRECRFQAEIVAIERTDRKGNLTRIDKDEHVRAEATLDGLGKLPPVFSKTGTITAGNSSGITDGAAALVLVSERKLNELKLKPLARLVDAAVAAVDPRVMGIGPVPAVRKLVERTGWQVGDYAAIELNEAFAAQVLACDRELGFDRARLNPNGGAIALGHPIGCSGARITTTLVHHLRPDRVGARGLATLCVSGGMGVALAVEAT